MLRNRMPRTVCIRDESEWINPRDYGHSSAVDTSQRVPEGECQCPSRVQEYERSVYDYPCQSQYFLSLYLRVVQCRHRQLQVSAGPTRSSRTTPTVVCRAPAVGIYANGTGGKTAGRGTADARSAEEGRHTLATVHGTPPVNNAASRQLGGGLGQSVRSAMKMGDSR